MRILVFCFMILVIATQCQTKYSTGDNNGAIRPSGKILSKNVSDISIDQFISGHELMTHDLIQLKIIDTSVTTPLSETSYCDTIVHLNDSISYTIISVSDEAGLCGFYFLASLNSKDGKIITSKYLHPDCDVDYSSDTYVLNEHAIVVKNKIEVLRTTIFQKKDKTSPDEEENIDHRQIQRKLIVVLQTGQINDV